MGGRHYGGAVSIGSQIAAAVAAALHVWNAALAVLQSLPLQHAPGEWAPLGQGAMVLSLSCMLGASLVLLVSSKGKLLRGAALDGTAPLIVLILFAAS